MAFWKFSYIFVRPTSMAWSPTPVPIGEHGHLASCCHTERRKRKRGKGVELISMERPFLNSNSPTSTLAVQIIIYLQNCLECGFEKHGTFHSFCCCPEPKLSLRNDVYYSIGNPLDLLIYYIIVPIIGHMTEI
jgi:hypothetical protein